MNPKSVLITGANRGIGLEFVKQFLNQKEPPTHLFAACRCPENAEELKELQKKTTALKIVKLDLGDFDTINPLKEEVEIVVGDNGLNLLVNNAGVCHSEGLEKVTVEKMQECYNVNAIGPLMMSQAFSPLLIKASQVGKGSDMSCSQAAIVNISSGLGSIEELTHTSYPYRCSKTAQNMVGKMLSVDLKKEGVLVVLLCPGWVRTDMGTKAAHLSPETSVTNMLGVMSTLTEKDSGTFRSQCGRTIPW